jgi:hypothetical protein
MTPQTLWIPRTEAADPAFCIKSDELGWTVPFAEGIKVIRRWLATCTHNYKIGGYTYVPGQLDEHGQQIFEDRPAQTADECPSCCNLRSVYGRYLEGEEN